MSSKHLAFATLLAYTFCGTGFGSDCASVPYSLSLYRVDRQNDAGEWATLDFEHPYWELWGSAIAAPSGDEIWGNFTVDCETPTDEPRQIYRPWANGGCNESSCDDPIVDPRECVWTVREWSIDRDAYGVLTDLQFVLVTPGLATLTFRDGEGIRYRVRWIVEGLEYWVPGP